MNPSHPDHTAPAIRLTCGTCGQKFLLDETDSPPFCSERCKLIDLGRWLDEAVGLPHEGGPQKGEAIEQDESNDEADQPYR